MRVPRFAVLKRGQGAARERYIQTDVGRERERETLEMEIGALLNARLY
jgi:hypothetical protein